MKALLPTLKQQKRAPVTKSPFALCEFLFLFHQDHSAKE